MLNVPIMVIRQKTLNQIRESAMIRKIVCGTALMCCAVASHAAEQTFDWSYTGAWDDSRQVFVETRRIAGRFVVDDVDQDGTFTMPEVRSFAVNGVSWINCSGTMSCGLYDFAYTPGGPLDFYGSMSSDGRELYLPNFYHMIDTTRGYYSDGIEWPSGALDIVFSYFTDRTRFAISPVPEPQSWLMLGAGLALLSAASRRRSVKT